MKDRKNILRVGTFLAILMFLLIPLLSSPVVAAVGFRIGVYTANTPGGPVVGVRGPPGYKSPGWHTESDDGTGTLIVDCDCYIYDTNINGMGSIHYVELNLQKIWPPPYGPFLHTTTGIITLAPGTQNTPYPQTLSLSTNYTAGSGPVSSGGVETFQVWVVAECTDIATGQKAQGLWIWHIVV